ncbi:MAG: carbohydrate ABC transporter permease [Lachnospiraceae bacterium]
MKVKKSNGRKIFDVFNYTLLGLCVLVSLYPIINQVALSFSSAAGVLQNNVTIFPIDFTLGTYESIVADKKFFTGYRNTVMYCVLGTLLGLSMTSICAYALSKKNVYGANRFLKLIVFTMFFGGGLIPTFVLIRNLGFIDTIWAIIVPGCIIPYHLLIMRTYFAGLPMELEEASKIDGMGQLGYFFKIALPLSKPIIATMTLFIAVIYWNDWFAALMYINDTDMQPITLYLRNIMMGATMAAQEGDYDSLSTVSSSVQAAAMVLVITPVLCIYPFVQKYFVTGVMIGAVKG